MKKFFMYLEIGNNDKKIKKMVGILELDRRAEIKGC